MKIEFDLTGSRAGEMFEDFAMATVAQYLKMDAEFLQNLIDDANDKEILRPHEEEDLADNETCLEACKVLYKYYTGDDLK